MQAKDSYNRTNFNFTTIPENERTTFENQSTIQEQDRDK